MPVCVVCLDDEMLYESGGKGVRGERRECMELRRKFVRVRVACGRPHPQPVAYLVSAHLPLPTFSLVFPLFAAHALDDGASTSLDALFCAAGLLALVFYGEGRE